jgi:hypothetical protein
LGVKGGEVVGGSEIKGRMRLPHLFTQTCVFRSVRFLVFDTRLSRLVLS